MKVIELKSLTRIVGLLSVMILSAQGLQAQDFGGFGGGQGPGMFLDEDGDGINDLAPDADGDGIPNGLDEDYVRVGNGRGPGEFLDANGDGINDLAPDDDGDGIPNGMDDDYVRPADGSFGGGMGGGFGQGGQTGVARGNRGSYAGTGMATASRRGAGNR